MPLTIALERLRRKLGAELLDMRHARQRLDGAISRAESTFAALTDLLEQPDLVAVDECA